MDPTKRIRLIIKKLSRELNLTHVSISMKQPKFQSRKGTLRTRQSLDKRMHPMPFIYGHKVKGLFSKQLFGWDPNNILDFLAEIGTAQRVIQLPKAISSAVQHKA
jgi:hypothetical protein